MPCCGQKRAAIRNQTSPKPATAPGERPSSGTLIRYLQRSPILVEGSATGRRYAFSVAQPVQVVDPRDAGAILRSGFFRVG